MYFIKRFVEQILDSLKRNIKNHYGVLMFIGFVFILVFILFMLYLILLNRENQILIESLQLKCQTYEKIILDHAAEAEEKKFTSSVESYMTQGSLHILVDLGTFFSVRVHILFSQFKLS